jgi:transposase
LEAIQHSVEQSVIVIDTIKTLLENITNQLELIDKELEKTVKIYEKENFELIKTIPGIGKKTAIVLIAFTQGMKNFESSKQLISYFGLCPRIYESGTSVKGKARICKMGMSTTRKMLYLCALSAKKHNKACRELYDRLVLQGKSKKLALIAVANKLIKQAFSILKNKTEYVDNFLQQKFAY